MVATCFSGLCPMAGAGGMRFAPTTYYVDPGGLDTNDGSLAHPFREIRQALTKVIAGDTVLVSNGSYLGFDVNNIHGNVNNWITIKAPMHNATITVTTDRGDNRDTIFITGSSFIIVDGLKSFNANRAAMRIDSSDNITVRNVTFGNNAVWGMFTDFSDDTIVEDSELYGSGSQHGIYFSNSPDHPIARNNTIHDNAGCGIHMNGDISMGGDGLVQSALIEGNTIFNNGALGGSGINMDGVQNSTIRNNVLYNNHASGIANYHGDGISGPWNNEFYHNTIDMPADGRYALQITGSVGPVKVRNNILYNRNLNHGGLAYGDANDIANTDSDYNIMDRMTPDDWNTLLTLAQWQAQGHEKHSFSSLPSQMFVDVNNRDYHLSSNSTAIDKGETLATVTMDRDRNPRPSNVTSDIGAYEYQYPLVPDTTPPDMIIDLAASNVTHTTVDLSWTATGDDGKVGTASAYDLRYSKAALSEGTWAAATKVTGLPKPALSGTKEKFKVTGLTPNTKYYFAIKIMDEKNNTAAISNIVSVTTLKIIPDLFIISNDIDFSNNTPMEGFNLSIRAWVQGTNVTEKLNFSVEMRVDDLTIENKSVSLSGKSVFVDFYWITTKGTHNVSILVDTTKAITETNETNNKAAKAITVSAKPPPPLPDLYIRTEDINRPNWTLCAGDLVQLSLYIHAKNLTDYVNFTVEVRVDDIVIHNISVRTRTTNVEFVRFNWTAVRGAHQIKIILDPANTVAEANENNNTATKLIEVASPDVSISISDIQFPSKKPWTEGENVYIYATFKTDYILKDLKVNVHLELLIDNISKVNETMQAYVANESQYTINCDWPALGGRHYISARGDTTNALDEANETNNDATREIVVLKKPVLPKPDLSISASDISLPSGAITEWVKFNTSVMVHAVNLTGKINITVEMLLDSMLSEKKSASIENGQMSFQFNISVVRGQHNVTFRVTPEAGITEASTTNNMATKAFSVQAPPKKPHHQDMTATYTIIGVVIAAVIACIVGWFLLSKRKRKEKDPQ